MLLERNRRLSLRALKLEFELDDARLASLVEELVDVQQVAALEGKVLAWIGSASTEAPAGDSGTRESTIAPETRAAPRVATPEATVEAERRQLTVMFCDLVDSTEHAARLDAEDWREVVRGYQQTAAEVIERFDGHVAQYLGDGLLVYFGYPRAHEDDAERAVRAGLGIVDAVATANDALERKHELRLALRVGIHTGPVVVGDVGGGARRETLALGPTTNLAARIQSAADPGSIVLSGATLQLVQGVFVTRSLGARSLKGVGEVALHLAVQPSGVRSRLEGVAEGELTRFVGREQELGMLWERWERALEGEGQSVLVAGGAGIGKSRLVLALRKRLGGEAHTWLECRCSPYARGTTLHPVVELLERGLGLEPADAAAERLRKLETGVSLAGLDPQKNVPVLAELLGIPLDPRFEAPRLGSEQQRQRTFEVLTEWPLALGVIQPTLVLIEDLHWADPTTLELIGRLIEQAPTSHVLLVLTARPDFDAPWSHPKNWTPIALTRLRSRQAHEVVMALCEESPLPESAVREILDRSDGIPLYLEELTRAALESGGEGLAVSVPATLYDSLMARLDRLFAAKEVAQIAAVIGREFSYALLEAVAGLDEATLRAGLERLGTADLLFQRGAPPDASYAFRHALVQETAYDSLLRARRQVLHARVADAIEHLLPQRSRGEPELLAHHFAAGGVPERAVLYGERAGRRAVERSAYVEAVRHLSRALEQLAELPASEETRPRELGLLMLLGLAQMPIAGYASPESERTFARARALCQQLGGGAPLFPILFGLWLFYMAGAEREASCELADELQAIASRADDPGMRIEAHAAAGVTASWQGRHEPALAHLSRVFELYDAERDRAHAQFYGQDPAVYAHALAGWSEWLRGRPDRALEHLEGALEGAERLAHPFSLAGALVFLAMVRHERGKYDTFCALAERVTALAIEHGFAMWTGYAMALQGRAHVARGRVSSGLARIEEGLQRARATGARVNYAYFHCLELRTQVELERTPTDLSPVEETLSALDTRLDVSYAAEPMRLAGELQKLAGAKPEVVEASFQRALAVARAQEACSLELRAATSLARLWQRQGKRDEARQLLAPIYRGFTEGLGTRDLEDAKALLEEPA